MISTIFTRLKITSFRGFAEFLRDVDGLTGGIKRRAEEKHNRPRRPLSCLGQMSNSRALARERARSSKRRIEWRRGGEEMAQHARGRRRRVSKDYATSTRLGREVGGSICELPVNTRLLAKPGQNHCAFLPPQTLFFASFLRFFFPPPTDKSCCAQSGSFLESR